MANLQSVASVGRFNGQTYFSPSQRVRGHFLARKLGIGGRVDPGQPVDPLTRVDMSDPSLVKIDKFPVILTGWTG